MTERLFVVSAQCPSCGRRTQPIFAFEGGLADAVIAVEASEVEPPCCTPFWRALHAGLLNAGCQGHTEQPIEQAKPKPGFMVRFLRWLLTPRRTP